jgi:proline iminopeptidase
MAGAGRGAPLIVCHGGPGLWDMFGSLAGSLAGDVRVVRWDQRGCGRSERRGPYSVARSVADLDAVRAALGVERVAVLGHSWGATLALRYALDHPDRVSALIYVSGTGLGWDWHEPFQRAIAGRLAPSAARRAELRARARDRTEAEDRELAVAGDARRVRLAAAGLAAPGGLGTAGRRGGSINRWLARLGLTYRGARAEPGAG